jgi:hypothetical protein
MREKGGNDHQYNLLPRVNVPTNGGQEVVRDENQGFAKAAMAGSM